MKKHSPLARTRFGDIVAEFALPRRRSRDVVLLCGGMPGLPRQQALVEFFARQGFWTFYPRYRGTWESGGQFLRKSPEEDLREIIDALPRGFRDLRTGKIYRVRPARLFILGSSFGGPAAILGSRDPRVTAAVAISPVIDWRASSRTEPLPLMEKYIKLAFGEAYRFARRDWRKLAAGKLYNPAAHMDEVEGSKLLIFHAKDDESVAYRPTVRFAKGTGARLILLKRGGHLGLAYILKPRAWKEIRRFLKSHS